MSNFFEIDLSKKYTYDLTLCMADETPIISLPEAANINLTMRATDTSELSFKIPFKILSENQEYIHNDNFDLIQGDLLILLETPVFERYFVIKTPNMSADENNIEYKTIQCFSREIILSGKTMRNYSSVAPLFYPNIFYSYDQISWERYIPFDSSGNLTKVYVTNKTTLYVKTKDVTNTTDIFANTSLAVKDVNINNLNIVISKETDGSFGFTIFNTTYNNVGGVGILNEIETLTNFSWNIGYVSDLVIGERADGVNLQLKYRNFNVSEKSLLDILRNDVKNAFNCIFEFDTINKIINVYDNSEIIIDKGIYIDDVNFLKTLQVHFKYDEVCTRLRVYGSNNISIQNVSPLGQDYIEDFSLYMKFPFMNQELIDALNEYNTLLENNNGLFNIYLTQLATYNDNLSIKQVELSSLKNDLDILETNKEIAIKNQTSTTLIDSQITAKNSEILAKNNEITSVNNQISVVNSNIATLRNIITKENNFSEEQLKILNDLTIERVYNNDSYDNSTDLYNAALNDFEIIKTPRIEYEIDIGSLLDIVECQDEWKNIISLFSLITLRYNNFNIHDIQLRLVEYTHDYDAGTLKVIISNKDKIEEATKYVGSSVSNSVNTSATVAINKKMWDYAPSNNDWINNFISNAFDASSQMIIADDELMQFGKHGIIMSSSQDSGQLRLLHNILTMSENGTDWNLAITPQGSCREKLIGNIFKL